MTSFDIAQRLFQIVAGGFCIFMAIGGGIAHHTAEAAGVRTTVFTIYKNLPPAPIGPSYCSIFDQGDRGLVLPCDFKPPFIGWLQGGKYWSGCRPTERHCHARESGHPTISRKEVGFPLSRE